MLSGDVVYWRMSGDVGDYLAATQQEKSMSCHQQGLGKISVLGRLDKNVYLQSLNSDLCPGNMHQNM